MGTFGNAALAPIFFALASAYPTHIKCDLTLKVGEARNVMTTTDKIMGQAPSDSTTIATAGEASFTAGSTVTISFGSDFIGGIAHATAGMFSSGQFSSIPAAAATCAGTSSIVYKTSPNATTPLVWTAPADVASLSSIVLSFAGAPSGGTVYRRTISLTKVAAATTTGPGSASVATHSTTPFSAVVSLTFAALAAAYASCPF